jgi:NodT family efflux transporter outer membrane factor (OMF) lipoprotein
MKPVVAVALVLALAGCEVGPDFVPPAAPDVAHYDSGADPVVTEAADGAAQRFDTANDVPAEWWRLFLSPELDDTVRQGLAGNPTVEAAEATLRQSEHTLSAGYGVFFPQIGADFSATRQRVVPAERGLPGQGVVFNLYTSEATVGYTLDVFGGERRSVEALGANVDLQKNIARAAYLTLTSNIVDAAIASAGYDAELRATQEIVDLQREQVKLAGVQGRAGTVALSAVLSLQSQLETTEATLPALRQKLSQTDHLLAMLSGKLPADWQPPRLGFTDLALPRDLPLTVPSALVRQRPDILSAEASLHAASAQIGVATAALLPNLTLDGAFGLASSSFRTLLASGGQVWSVGAEAAEPLFDGGSLLYRRKATLDAFDAAKANYRETVLTAFEQVADTLRAIEHDAEALAADERALETATRALQLVQANYAAGLATYADVLIADAQYHQAEITDIQTRTTRYQDTVALFVALGGGWWNAEGERAEK